MEKFDPNDIGVANGNFFGLPGGIEESEIVLFSVPWDVTVSYGHGTSKGPEKMLEASMQIDLFDLNVPNAWDIKLGTLPINKDWYKKGTKARKIAEKVISELEKGRSQESLADMIDLVNEASRELNTYVEQTSKSLLGEGKLVGLIGGDHSVPLGLIKALSEYNEDFGVLHIDAHADLRDAYEGFQYSHASIMYNVLKEVPQVSRLTQVGIRDFCAQEYSIITEDSRVEAFTDFSIAKEIFEGGSWGAICARIVETLPDRVYVSFDIDGLSPEYCPGTGTPVPGGLSFSQAEYLLYVLANSGKKIVGFDLCEVNSSENGDWDANVGARILYKLSLYSKNSKN